MFRRKPVPWMSSRDCIARYLSMDSIPKTLRARIKLDPRKDKVLVWSSGTHPDVIVPSMYDTIDLGNRNFTSKYKTIVFWSDSEVRVDVPISHRTSPNTPNLTGKVELHAQIDPDGTIGDSVGKMLVDGFFNSGSSRSSLDSKELHRLVKGTITGKGLGFLDGLNENNLMDEEFQGTLRKKTEDHISEKLANTGIGIRDVKIKWAPTSKMRTQAKESQNDAKLERALVDSGTRAVDSLVTDGQDALDKRQMKKLARKIKIRESGEIEVEKENAKRRAKKAKEKTKIEISEMRDDAERKKDAKDLELQKEQDDHKHKKRVREHELKKDERQHKAETKIKEISALTELFRILNDAKNQGILEEEDKALLRDRLSLSDSTKQTAEIHDETLTSLEGGHFTAKEIDRFSKNMREKASDGSLSNIQRSNLWAGVAVYERHRGSAEAIERMEEALSNSFRFDQKNPFALKCKMEYLWNRHPQQFYKGKITTAPHMKEQVKEIEGILEELVNHDGITDGERSDMLARHQKALVTLARDPEDGNKYIRKLEQEYDVVFEG